MPHLWEVKHPYYCSESNFYSREPYTRWGTWPEFRAAYEDADMDMNMVFRFDWHENEAHADVYYRNGNLQMFFMSQRKGIFACHEISVCRADEASVIEFLRPRWEYMKALWQPLSEPIAATA